MDDALAVSDIAAEPHRWNTYVLAGLGVWSAIVAADWMSDDTILIPLLAIVPLVTAVGGTVRQTTVAGTAAVVTAVAFGWVDDIAWSRRHWVAIATTLLACGLGLWLAATRAGQGAPDCEFVRGRRTEKSAARLARGRSDGRMVVEPEVRRGHLGQQPS